MAESFASTNPFRRPSAAGTGPGPGPGSSGPALSPSVFDSLSHPPTPTADEFRAQLQSLPPASVPLPPTSFQKPKVVKKVRVQSPPPSSPDSPAAAPAAFPPWPPARPHPEPHGPKDVPAEDPFANAAASRSTDPADADEADHDASCRRRPPALGNHNGHNGADASHPQTRKTPTMDVTAFSRLLMTGQRDSSMTPSQFATLNSSHRGAALMGDSGSVTDASSVSRQSLFDASHALSETPRTSHEMSDAGDDERPNDMLGGGQWRKKKPPPPSSRHGKLIKVELQERDEGARSQTWPSETWEPTLSDVNKPLPPAPGRSQADGSSESVFDREAAGRTPEPDLDSETADVPLPRPPTPPHASHSQAAETASITGRTNNKPLPPPRRNHARADSKCSVSALPSPGAGLSFSARDEGTAPSRSSLDSTRSRSSSLRVSNGAPMPPPSRRPNPAARASMIITSPSAPSLTSPAFSSREKDPAATDSLLFQESLSARLTAAAAAAQTADTSGATSPALTRNNSGMLADSQGNASRILPPPPPPPPARNASVRSRKPPSVSSLETATARRASRDSMLSSGPTPPPPPARHRGGSRGSRGSADWSGSQSRRASVGSVLQVLADGALAVDAGGEPDPVPLESIDAAESSASAAHDILADLDALQREVDALRAQHEGAAGGRGAAQPTTG